MLLVPLTGHPHAGDEVVLAPGSITILRAVDANREVEFARPHSNLEAGVEEAGVAVVWLESHDGLVACTSSPRFTYSKP